MLTEAPPHVKFSCSARARFLTTHNAFEAVLEPFDRLLLVDPVGRSHLSLAASSLSHSLTRSSPSNQSVSSHPLPSKAHPRSNVHAAVEVHSIDSNRRVILDSKIDMFTNAESEVARLGEVPPLQLIFLHLQTTLENFFGLGTADGNVNGDLLITTDAEGSNGVAGFAYNDSKMP